MTDHTGSRWWVGVALSAAMPFLLLVVLEGAKATAVPAPGGPPEIVAAPGLEPVHLLFALLSAVGLPVAILAQTLFPAFLFLDAGAVRRDEGGWFPNHWLCGLAGVLAVLPAYRGLAPAGLPIHAINPTHSIALVAVAYLAFRHRAVGVP